MYNRQHRFYLNFQKKTKKKTEKNPKCYSFNMTYSDMVLKRATVVPYQIFVFYSSVHLYLQRPRDRVTERSRYLYIQVQYTSPQFIHTYTNGIKRRIYFYQMPLQISSCMHLYIIYALNLFAEMRTPNGSKNANVNMKKQAASSRRVKKHAHSNFR